MRGSFGATGGFGEAVFVIVNFEASRLGRCLGGLVVVVSGAFGTRSVSVSAMGLAVPALWRVAAVRVGEADIVDVVFAGYWVSVINGSV